MTTTASAVRYRWSDLPRDTPMALLERKRIIGERMMISQVLLRKGCYVPTHSHENEQFACIMSGTMRFEIGEDGARSEMTLHAGEILHLPANVPHAAEAVEDSLVLDLFSPPSQTTGIDRH